MIKVMEGFKNVRCDVKKPRKRRKRFKAFVVLSFDCC